MTSTGLFGGVGEFIAERDTFNAYVERMEMFFTANNIVETTGEGSTQANRVVAERKRPIFLTEVGAEVYSTLSNLLAPTKPKDTPFVDIVRVLQKHYNRSKPRTVGELRLIFAKHVLPEKVVSDNGPQFTYNEIAEFMSKNGIKHRPSATLSPSI